MQEVTVCEDKHQETQSSGFWGADMRMVQVGMASHPSSHIPAMT